MCKFKVWISARAALNQLDIVVQQGVANEHFDLVGGKEAPGACVATVPKGQTVLIDADKLIKCRNLSAFGSRGMLNHLGEAQRIEAVGLGENGRVKVDGHSGHLDSYASWDVLAVGQCKGLDHLALEGSCMTKKKDGQS